jgi:hypothetical protein
LLKTNRNNLRGPVDINFKLDKGKPFERVGRKATDPALQKAGKQGCRVGTAHIFGCISHGINDVTNGGAVLLSCVHFLKKIRIRSSLPLLVIFALCFLPLTTSFAATVTVAWDENAEMDVIGYKF